MHLYGGIFSQALKKNLRDDHNFIYILCNVPYLTLPPPDGPYDLMTNTVKEKFSGGKIQNIVDVLTAVFYDSLRFHLTYLTKLTPEKRSFIWALTVK